MKINSVYVNFFYSSTIIIDVGLTTGESIKDVKIEFTEKELAEFKEILIRKVREKFRKDKNRFEVLANDGLLVDKSKEQPVDLEVIEGVIDEDVGQ